MGLMGLSLVRALWHFYLIYALMGLVGGGTAPVPYSTVISRWFDRRRGLALGLMMVGTGLGMFFMPSFAHALIERWGWRQAYLVLGTMVILITIPVVGALLRDSPQAMGLSPDGRPPQPQRREEQKDDGLELAHALRVPTFWLLVVAFFLVSATVHGCLTHLAPMLMDRGVSPQEAAQATSLLGGAVLIGRVVTGYLLDRLYAPRVAMGFFAGTTIGVFLLWSGATHELAFASAFLVGLGMGAEVDIIAYLVSRYFGLRAFGSIYGYAFAAYILGGLAGPLAMGVGVDRTGAYQWPLGSFLIAMALAIGLMWRLGPYPRGEGAREVEAISRRVWERAEMPSADSSQ